MHCSVIEHGMTSLSFQIAVQKNEAELSFLCSLKVKWRDTVLYNLNKGQLPMF